MPVIDSHFRRSARPMTTRLRSSRARARQEGRGAALLVNRDVAGQVSHNQRAGVGIRPHMGCSVRPDIYWNMRLNIIVVWGGSICASTTVPVTRCSFPRLWQVSTPDPKCKAQLCRLVGSVPFVKSNLCQTARDRGVESYIMRQRVVVRGLTRGRAPT